MYIHMHWSYRHPYAARTWTPADWHSYLTGLRSLGYEWVQVWPMLDAMPPEPTASDLVFLRQLGEVIRTAQDELGMRVAIVSCPNTIGNERSGGYSFAERPYFACEWKIDPGDPAAVDALLAGRRKQFAPISHADAVVVIDSDPGGYSGSTNEQFVDLMTAQIGVMRELNPASELIYWMHFGWENYNRFWELTSRWQPGDPPVHFDPEPRVFQETLALLKDRAPEPWSVLANNTPWGHREATEALGLAGRRCGLPYGLIEGEPTFPLANCNPALIANTMRGYARAEYPQGFLANAQTHVLQLPHTYLVAEHWLHGAAARPSMTAFGEQIIPGLGELIASAWGSLEGGETGRMRELASKLRRHVGEPHASGPSSGLLVGSADRFLEDLAMNLDVRAGLHEAAQAGSDEGTQAALRALMTVLRPYQKRLGFVDAYGGPLHAGLNQPAARLGDPQVNAVLADFDDWRDPSVRHGILPRLLDAVEACS
jgi:hypothetical protein